MKLNEENVNAQKKQCFDHISNNFVNIYREKDVTF